MYHAPNRFQRIATGLNVQPVLDAIAAHPELWKLNTTRQNYPGSVQKDTECIFLRWCRDHSLAAAFRDLDAEWVPSHHDLFAAVVDLLYEVVPPDERYKLARVLLTNLRAGGVIDLHSDDGAYAEATRRHHIALQSDEGNVFEVDGESFHAKPGELWWFNHRKPHTVANNSQRDRLHLIVDILPC